MLRTYDVAHATQWDRMLMPARRRAKGCEKAQKGLLQRHKKLSLCHCAVVAIVPGIKCRQQRCRRARVATMYRKISAAPTTTTGHIAPTMKLNQRRHDDNTARQCPNNNA